MYSKYENHQKVLLFLKNKREEYIERKEKLKKEDNIVLYTQKNGKLTAEQIAKGLNLDLCKINDTLIDLNLLGFLNREDSRYSLKEDVIIYIESNYFKNKRKEYINDKIIEYIKNTIVIVLGMFSIYTFVNMQLYQDKSTNKQLLQLQSQVESIQEELVELKQKQKLILIDSLKSENP